MPMKPCLTIISPSLADANTGNWRTAARWTGFLSRDWQVEVRKDWHPSDGFGGNRARQPDAMIALHARRSADALARFSEAGGPLALVLTGTDLYRDIRDDATARRSLELADALVCLQERGPDELPQALRAKTRVIYQSARTLRPAEPARRSFDLLLVGHLRPEKDPLTALRAMALVYEPRLRLLQVGDFHDPTLREPVQAAAAADPRIRLLGPLPHPRTRQLIRRGRLLVLPSRMEGGANVLIEAVRCGVPVLGSRIPGSVGMLGEDYPGWFPVGDAAALASLVRRCIESPSFLDSLRAHCEARAPRFAPEAERGAVRRLAQDLLDTARRKAVAAADVSR